MGAAGALQRGARPVNVADWILAGRVLLIARVACWAMAEASLTRMTRVRALSGSRRRAGGTPRLLVRLETDPPRYLNVGATSR